MIKDLWYKNAVVYCLSVATYMDANGDGIGDFQGLMRRLDYLHGLGVTAIWLMPFQMSPGRSPRFLKPPVFVRRVINNEIDYDSNSTLGGSVGEFDEIAERAECWINGVII